MKQIGREVLGRSTMGQTLAQLAADADNEHLERGYVLAVYFTDADLARLMVDLVLRKTFSEVGATIGSMLVNVQNERRARTSEHLGSCPTCKRPYYQE